MLRLIEINTAPGAGLAEADAFAWAFAGAHPELAAAARFFQWAAALLVLQRALVLGPHCPDRKTPFFAVKRPAGPYKSAIENRFT